VDEYQQCLNTDEGRHDILWGCDEMLLSALAVGARGAIGSTYNIALPLYRRIIDAFAAGRMDEARRCQGLSVKLVRTIARWPFHPAMKETMKMIGLDCGRCRLPQPRLSKEDVVELKQALEEMGFFDQIRRAAR
jgi:N-acetylneuraminate lyase